MEVNVITMTNTKCNTDYLGDILDSMICARDHGKDACQGDSGGKISNIFYNKAFPLTPPSPVLWGVIPMMIPILITKNKGSQINYKCFLYQAL